MNDSVCTCGGRLDGIYPVSIPKNLLHYRDSPRPCRELCSPTRADGVYDEGVQEVSEGAGSLDDTVLELGIANVKTTHVTDALQHE